MYDTIIHAKKKLRFHWLKNVGRSLSLRALTHSLIESGIRRKANALTEAFQDSVADEVPYPDAVRRYPTHAWCACRSFEGHCRFRPARPKWPHPWRLLPWRGMTSCGWRRLPTHAQWN